MYNLYSSWNSSTVDTNSFRESLVNNLSKFQFNPCSQLLNKTPFLHCGHYFRAFYSRGRLRNVPFTWDVINVVKKMCHCVTNLYLHVTYFTCSKVLLISVVKVCWLVKLDRLTRTPKEWKYQKLHIRSFVKSFRDTPHFSSILSS